MKIGILSSSRADFGIYFRLLEKLKSDAFFTIEIIAFGTHLSKFHGFTLDHIKSCDFKVIHEISSILVNDDEVSISSAYALTALKFAEFWKSNRFDLVLCLGDRFEMAAAVQAGIPFGVRFGHIHGGETTLGAIDNIYRHQITLAAFVHFPATDVFAERIKEIRGNTENIYPVGSLSIDGLENMLIPSEQVFREKYSLKNDYVLLTFHPETVSSERNTGHAKELLKALTCISSKIDLVITMPNADTHGTVFRTAIRKLKENNSSRITLIENFGKLNYFAAMKYCKLLIGNTSSGIIEAASLKKFVINVGDRQKGRLQSKNVVNVPFTAHEIEQAFTNLVRKGDFALENIYYKQGSSALIVKYLKNLYNEKF